MSAIAGLIALGATPIDPQALDRMLGALRRRGDEIDVALTPEAGLGQVHLRTGSGLAEAMRPIRADESVWLAADARIDARVELTARLRRAGIAAQPDAPHAQLVAQAFGQWQEGCGQHLLGDFAFAAWNARERRLTCVRDHFGVRPLYYAANAHRLAFASDMRALLALDDVSHELDEVALGDLLMFGSCMEADRTIFRDIRCLPPACVLTAHAASGRIGLAPYWHLCREREVRLGDAQAYALALRELLQQAVADRLPQGTAAYQLSGGLDSTSIVALAAQLRGPGAPRELAYTYASGTLAPEDREADFAELAAAALPVNLIRQELDAYGAFERMDEPDLGCPYPLGYPLLAPHHDMLHALAGRGAKVLFSGYAADAAFAPSSNRYAALLRQGRLLTLGREVAHHALLSGSLRGMGLRFAFQRSEPDTRGSPELPDWLDPGFSRRIAAPERWERWWALYHGAIDGEQQLTLPWMHRQFEVIELWPLPLVGRYPFLDLRLVQFLLGLPNAMLANKRVLRQAMHGLLPAAILERPKTALIGDPVRTLVTNGKLNLTDRISRAAALPWIDGARYRSAFDAYAAGRGQQATWASALVATPLALSIWLEQQSKSRSDQ